LAFEQLMLDCGVLMVGLVGLALWRLPASLVRMAAALAFMAASPLLLGSVLYWHYDLVPAAITALGIAAVLGRHERIGAAAIGLGAITKIYPIVLLPPLLIYVRQRQGSREAALCAAIALAAIAAVVLPFAIIGPTGLGDALNRQLTRPLQIESLAAALLMTVRGLWGSGISIETAAGSQNLVGAVPGLFAVIESVALIGALAGTWLWFGRGRATPTRFVRAGVASVCLYIALGKVLSPQYLVWLIPLVPLVGARRGILAAVLLAVAYLLTQAYFPGRYFSYVDQADPLVALTVFLRDLSVLAVAGVLVLPPPRIWRPIQSPAQTAA